MTDQQVAALVAQLREWAAETEPSTPEADAAMRVYFDAADLIDDLSARLARAEQELAIASLFPSEAEGALRGLDDVFIWIEENYPAALVAMPAELFRRIGVAGEALAGREA